MVFSSLVFLIPPSSLLSCFSALLPLCFFFSFFCPLLRISSVFAALSFSSCFLRVLLDCKCSYNDMKNSTSSTNNKSSKYKRNNKNNKSKSNSINDKTRNNYKGKGGTQLERSCLRVPWVEGLCPLPRNPSSCFYFVVPRFHFWPFWVLCFGVKTMMWMSWLTGYSFIMLHVFTKMEAHHAKWSLTFKDAANAMQHERVHLPNVADAMQTELKWEVLSLHMQVNLAECWTHWKYQANVGCFCPPHGNPQPQA